MIPSYTKSVRHDNRDAMAFYDDTSNVVIQEKVDGSQFSFMVDSNGQAWCRSKSVEFRAEAAPSGFTEPAAHVLKMQEVIPRCVIFRCEYLRGPKHNHLQYGVKPRNGLVLFDVCPWGGLVKKHLLEDALDLDIDCVSNLIDILPSGLQIKDITPENVREIFGTSMLGGPIEGVVMKDYDRGYLVKVVSKELQEVVSGKPKVRGESRLGSVVAKYRTERRWEKAIEKMKDAGSELSEKDIGTFMKTINVDLLEEEADSIKEDLFLVFKKEILKGCTDGAVDFYRKYVNKTS